MIHPATSRAVLTAINALGTSLDIGFVFPPKAGQDRGFGQWTNRDLSPDDVVAMLPRAASANARGGNIYMRLSPAAKTAHPGIILLDDLTSDAVAALDKDGLQPCLTVQTSKGNFQCWLRLVGNGTIDYGMANAAARHLAQLYAGDPRAVSPRQPGRLPGFTNRKPKHQGEDGRFPFVTIANARPGLVTEAGPDLLSKLATGTARAAAGASPEKPPMAAKSKIVDLDDSGPLAVLYRRQRARIAEQLKRGVRPVEAASSSEIDFAFAFAAIQEGWSWEHVSGFIRSIRPTKSPSYADRTVWAALRNYESRSTVEISTPWTESENLADMDFTEANSP